jgi:probable rRNA maturation factor
MRIKPAIILKRRVPGLSERALMRFLIDACRAAKLRGAVNLLVTGNREIRELNWRFKGNRHSTDVLSFPGPDFLTGFAGDIAISLDVASRNARILKHSVAEEVRILALHGILHLAGYDHEDDNGEMALKEQTLRKRFMLPTALIERSSVNARPLKSANAKIRKPRVSR